MKCNAFFQVHTLKRKMRYDRINPKIKELSSRKFFKNRHKRRTEKWEECMKDGLALKAAHG